MAATAPPVGHVLFADDSLLFVKATRDGAREVSSLLDTNCEATSQRINHSNLQSFSARDAHKQLEMR